MVSSAYRHGQWVVFVGSENKISPNHLWLAKDEKSNGKKNVLLFTHHPSIIIHYHPSIIIHPSWVCSWLLVHSGPQHLLSSSCSFGPKWPTTLLHPIPNSRPKRTTTQRVVVGWSDGGGEEGAREARAKVETMYRRSKVRVKELHSLYSPLSFSP